MRARAQAESSSRAALRFRASARRACVAPPRAALRAHRKPARACTCTGWLGFRVELACDGHACDQGQGMGACTRLGVCASLSLEDASRMRMRAQEMSACVHG
eukprot:scaffold121475_cov36-Phaeocystis_antarctica.AAC.3